jgi:phytoene dehydrogenase-like protein
MSDPVDAVVVGAGPNGLAAAVVLAAAGLEVEVVEAASTIGGGARTHELTLPGYRNDVCSAVHPMAVASPFLRAVGLSRRVPMLQPDVAFAHPLDGGRAGIAWRDLDRTAEGLGPDGDAWRALVGPLSQRWEAMTDLLLSDFRSVPRDPVLLGALVRRVVEQGSRAWNLRFDDEVAPAMLTGVSAHAIAPPRALAPAGAGLFMAALAHAVGWPVPQGGSQSIVDALADLVVANGGRVRVSTPVRSLDELTPCRALLLDITPLGLLNLAGERLPASYARWLRRFRYGDGVCKVDFALSGPVPWTAPGCELAGTLHLGGTRAEMAAAERDVQEGRHSARPFVLAAQPGVVDPTRAPEGKHTFWTYTHVPSGSTEDVSEAVVAQVERFAPGFRDVIEHKTVMTAAQEAQYNLNYVGGDIASGAPTPWQLVMRPVPRWDPYRTPLPGTYLCSASTPPGPAVHGMAGLHAASRALRQVFGDRRDPLELVRALP